MVGVGAVVCALVYVRSVALPRWSIGLEDCLSIRTVFLSFAERLELDLEVVSDRVILLRELFVRLSTLGDSRPCLWSHLGSIFLVVVASCSNRFQIGY